ncbi:hypothetical protein CHUAL_002965 [Chamberlinius hualienensis]
MHLLIVRQSLIYSRFLSNRVFLQNDFVKNIPLSQRILNQRFCSSFVQNADTDDRRNKRGNHFSSTNSLYHGLGSQNLPLVSVTGTSYGFKSRSFHTCRTDFDKEKSKVEQTVDALKETIKTKETTEAVATAKPVAVKKTIGQRIVAELKHYYHGFRLLFIDISISAKLLWSIARGNSLSRREHKLLIRTVSDIFRLVPFSVFIIVPFMEFLLPVFIKLFPNMLPSTFQSSDEREAKMKKSLKVKLEMAKFLQDTLEEMSVQSKGDKRSQTAREFSSFFEKVRTSGEQASNEDILRFSKLFEDELTLDSLNRPQLTALCRLLELQPFGTTNFLRFQLRMRLRNLIADDKMIQSEGVHNLDTQELQAACKARGMRAYGVADLRMRSQLQQWLELSLNEKIPPSLLLLSRAMYISEQLPPADQLKVTLSALPESVTTQTKAKIGEVEGKVDNKTKIEIIREEQKKIKIEKEEELQLQTDDAPVIKEPVSTVEPKVVSGEKVAEIEAELSSKDLDVIEDALENISTEKKKLMLEREELQDLKEEMADYKEDMEELKDVVVLSGLSEKELRLNKASQRLFKQVDRMINKIDNVIVKLEVKGEHLRQNGDDIQHKEELVSIDELIQAMKKLQTTPDSDKLQKIATVLGKIDDDQDGSVKIDDMLQVIQLIGQENVKLNSRQVNEIVQLLDKEENIETVERIEKEVEREEQHRKAEAVKTSEKQ